MLIDKKEIEKLSDDIRKIIDGQEIDLRDNREGILGILKNDIHTLATQKNEQMDSFRRERDLMSDTLANISHQLKTPLTSMMIMADLLEDAPLERREEFLSNIKLGLVRMEWLVSTLLKMAKLDAGVIEFLAECMPAEGLVSLALEPIQVLLDLKNQNAICSCETELICEIGRAHV